ncbi:Cystathionine beta-lyase/cystathionine gamma-synthase, partial [mine drainage metagenome]
MAVGSREVIGKIAAVESPLLGATLSPMNAWLILRGIKTLSLRMEAHTLRAGALASLF